MGVVGGNCERIAGGNLAWPLVYCDRPERANPKKVFAFALLSNVNSGLALPELFEPSSMHGDTLHVQHVFLVAKPLLEFSCSAFVNRGGFHGGTI
ncbi:hypothetical protein C5Y96_02960 [Blastopirellula marina]|uniref:Uncharacterized protein n=1 Tax=Blastopirellula marina TaxID=124 RepID=A0A2S8G304_9BACT|nr:hypothetical protein C5Y96_02960 [Blastopirellula marina]RCS55154.1 hypothetical protein DTL36_02965 [Bremerella cremea]